MSAANLEKHRFESIVLLASPGECIIRYLDVLLASPGECIIRYLDVYLVGLAHRNRRYLQVSREKSIIVLTEQPSGGHMC